MVNLRSQQDGLSVFTRTPVLRRASEPCALDQAKVRLLFSVASPKGFSASWTHHVEEVESDDDSDDDSGDDAARTLFSTNHIEEVESDDDSDSDDNLNADSDKPPSASAANSEASATVEPSPSTVTTMFPENPISGANFKVFGQLKQLSFVDFVQHYSAVMLPMPTASPIKPTPVPRPALRRLRSCPSPGRSRPRLTIDIPKRGLSRDGVYAEPHSAPAISVSSAYAGTALSPQPLLSLPKTSVGTPKDTPESPDRCGTRARPPPLTDTVATWDTWQPRRPEKQIIKADTWARC